MEREAVDDLLQVLDRAHVGGHDEAVLPGDPPAVDDLGRGLGELRHAGNLPWRGANPDHRAERIAERARVELGAVAQDHAVALEPLDALGHRRGREADPPAELGHAEPRVGLELGEEASVDRIERSILGASVSLPSIFRHELDYTCDRTYTSVASPLTISAVGTTSSERARVRPEVYFGVSAVFHYLGPSFAVLLFARVAVLGVAELRLVSAALVFALWRRPWRAVQELDRDGRRLLFGWGAVLAVMNACFYTAISRLPLGTVAAIEFLPVIGLAALGARSRRNLLALALAVGGVCLLSHVVLSGQPLGLAFAFANAILFALYIVLADRVAKRPQPSGIDGLAAAMLIAVVIVTPIGGLQATSAVAHPTALLAGAGVGISSSVIPYVTDQLAMARLPRSSYALMVALLPALATVIGLVVLAQVPNLSQVAGVGLVVGGVGVHQPSGSPRGD